VATGGKYLNEKNGIIGQIKLWGKRNSEVLLTLVSI